jgi:Ca-activated chloride channel family protein
MQMTVIGRYKNTNDLRNITFRLTGRAGGERREFRYGNLDMPVRSDGNEFLPRLWASRRVGWLLEQIRLNGDTKELRDEIVELGTRYGLVTPYTSYLATDGTMANVRRDVAVSGAFASPAKTKVAERSGADAVRMSVQQNAMQSNVTLSGEHDDSGAQVIVRNSAMNQFVGNKSFTNQDGVWIDADAEKLKAPREIRIEFGSSEYFALISKNREIAKFLALGEQVVVEWQGTVYRIFK